eukprot:5279703-Amphidinium_carterae.1
MGLLARAYLPCHCTTLIFSKLSLASQHKVEHQTNSTTQHQVGLAMDPKLDLLDRLEGDLVLPVLISLLFDSTSGHDDDDDDDDDADHDVDGEDDDGGGCVKVHKATQSQLAQPLNFRVLGSYGFTSLRAQGFPQRLLRVTQE